ncbi:MAG: peptidase [Pseudomonadales bacterium]
MTYCVAISVDQGLVFVSDSRTNSGVDNVSTYSKMRSFGVPGERQFVICAAGNLATTQSVFLQLERDIAGNAPQNLMNLTGVADAASYLGRVSVEQQRETPGGPVFEASFLIGGEVAGSTRSRSFMVYPEGNHIASGPQTPFLQIGEIKYGKPILDRVVSADTSLEDATVCALLSMDATTRSNVSVGPPIEVRAYHSGTLQPPRYVSFGDDSPYLHELRRAWTHELHAALRRLPAVGWNEAATAREL